MIPDTSLPRLEVTEIEVREIQDAGVRAFTCLRWEVRAVSEQQHPSVPFPLSLELARYQGREEAVFVARRKAAEFGVRAVLHKDGRRIVLGRYTPAEDQPRRDERVVRNGVEVGVDLGISRRFRVYGSVSDAKKAERRLLLSKAARERFVRYR